MSSTPATLAIAASGLEKSFPEDPRGLRRRPRDSARLDVTSFGMQVENFPPSATFYPEHDHATDGQEEVYTVLDGAATLHPGGESYGPVPGAFARVGPTVRRKITTGDKPARILALGGVPGRAYQPPPYTENGAPMLGA